MIYIKLPMHKLKTIVADNLYKFNHFKMNISRTFQKNYYFYGLADIFPCTPPRIKDSRFGFKQIAVITIFNLSRFVPFLQNILFLPLFFPAYLVTGFETYLHNPFPIFVNSQYFYITVLQTTHSISP